MPLAELMYWNTTQKRWFKKYRNRMYSVSPKKLGYPATKEASRQAANNWWQRKQAEIDDALGKPKQHPPHVLDAYQTAIENHRAYARWHRRNEGDIEEAQRSEAIVDWLDESLQGDDPPYPLLEEQLDPLTKYHSLPAEWGKWVERMREQYHQDQAEKAVPKENTIRGHVDDYLALKRAQCQAKGKIVSYSSVRQWLEVFKSWVDPYAPIESLNEVLWEKYFIYLADRVAKKELSPASAKDYIGAARSFIRNRWERRLIELPRNLTSRQLAVAVPIKDPVVFTPEEITRYLSSAAERTRLYILLMLNCGMYPQDITFLCQNEVDWERGRIARKRTKTRNRSENVPKVDYPLWRETFALLKKYRSDHAEWVLLNEKGKPLLTEKESRNGKLSRNQNIQFAYRRLQEKLKVEGKAKKGLKAFRKTGATLLEQSPYGRFAEHYLGEAPSTIAARHYAHKNGVEFDQAVKWLGQRLGIEPPPAPAANAATSAVPTTQPVAVANSQKTAWPPTVQGRRSDYHLIAPKHRFML